MLYILTFQTANLEIMTEQPRDNESSYLIYGSDNHRKTFSSHKSKEEILYTRGENGGEEDQNLWVY